MCYMLISFLLAIEVVRVTGAGFCDKEERPSNSPDFYAVHINMNNGKYYKLYQREEENIYKSKDDGRQLYRGQDGYWKICNLKLCKDLYKSRGNTSVPRSEWWTNLRDVEEILIEIQGFQSCKEENGFRISNWNSNAKTNSTRKQGGMTFEECKKWGENQHSGENPVFLISHSPQYHYQCKVSFSYLAMIEKDANSTLYFNEIPNSKTSTTFSSNSSDSNSTFSEALSDQKILSIGISGLCLVILFTVTLTLYICKVKGCRNKTRIIVTENESYGNFLDYEDYCEEKKNNIITDSNVYYEK